MGSQNEHRCRIELLGPTRLIQTDQTQMRFATQKTEGLLAYLALRPGPHPRERVIDMFWPDMDLPDGRNNLSTTLVSLRRQLEPANVRRGSVLVASHSDIGLNPAAVTTDVAEFERWLDQAARTGDPGASQTRADLLERAVALWRGDPLPGNYQDWAVLESERLQTRFQEALLQLASDREALGDVNAALLITQRSAALEPYSEELHCQLIRLYVLNDHRAEARDAHRRFERLFADEFGAEPSEETRRIVAQLMAQPRAAPRATVAPIPAVRATPPTRVSTPIEPLERGKGVPVALPPIALTRFYGRSAELTQLGQLLLPFKGALERPCRLVTLIGPGGIGKTRLSLEFARQAVERFELWCAFVPLAELTDATQIVGQIASVLRLPPVPSTTPLDQIIAFLRQLDRPEGPALLILDNLEHLLTAAELIQTLLEQVQSVIVLCTSRHRLGVRGERLVPVAPLPVPEQLDAAVEAKALASLLALPSVRLYVDRAQAVRPDFGLTPTNAPAVAALCRQLEGNPLALELAAAWVRVLPPRKMWERLTRGQDIPEGSYADLPARHRTLSAALEWSFRLLTPAQKQFFARLSIFRGGWTQETAETVCAEPDAILLLAELQEASLITATDERDDEVRYDFLETVRAYSRKQLEARGEDEDLARRHAEHFLAFAAEAEPHLYGVEQAIWFARLEAEHDNLRMALSWYQHRQDDPAASTEFLRFTLLLSRFWNVRGYWGEGWQLLMAARSRIEDVRTEMAGKVFNAAAGFALRVGEMTEARFLFEQALATFRELSDQRNVANLLHNLGLLAMHQGDLDRAQPLYEESLALCRQFSNDSDIADELHHLGWVAHERGDLQRAQALYEESLATRPAQGDRRGGAFTLQNLANVAVTLGDLVRAQTLSEQNLEIRRELGDRTGIADALFNLANIARNQNDLVRAQSLVREGLVIRWDIGDRRGIVNSLEWIAELATNQKRAQTGARFYGAVDSLRETTGIARLPTEAAIYQRSLSALQSQLSAQEFASVWEAGRASTLEQIVAEALVEETDANETQADN